MKPSRSWTPRPPRATLQAVDADLRHLERRVRSGGSAADVAAYLRAALRAGGFEPDREPLLRWLAAEAPPELRALGASLERFGRDVVVRAGVVS